MSQSGVYSFKMLKNRYGGRFGRALVGVEMAKMRLFDVDQETGSHDGQTQVSQKDLDGADQLLNREASSGKQLRRNKVIDFE